MKGISLNKKLISGIVIGSMLLTAGVAAFANESGSEDAAQGAGKRFGLKSEKRMAIDKMLPAKGMENLLGKLVEEGVISQAKADSILEYVQKKADERKELSAEERKELKQGERIDILAQLTEEGIITASEADSIKAKQKELQGSRFTNGLEALVEKGVVSADAVAEIQSYMKAFQEERKAEFEKFQSMTEEERKTYMEAKIAEKKAEAEKIKNMTNEERKAYIDAKKAERKDIVSELLEDGVITQEQAEEVRKALPGFKGYGQKGLIQQGFKGRGRGERIQTKTPQQ